MKLWKHFHPASILKSACAVQSPGETLSTAINAPNLLAPNTRHRSYIGAPPGTFQMDGKL